MADDFEPALGLGSPSMAAAPAPALDIPAAGVAGQSGSVPAADHAAKSVVRFGGLRGGRGRADGLTPGSPEADAADRERDARRKREQRAARAKLRVRPEPPPLPAAPLDSAPADATPPLAGDPDTLLPAAERALVLWAGTDVEPVLVEFIAALQEWRKLKRELRLKKTSLPDQTIREMLADSGWPELAKKNFCEAGSRLLAELLNKAGVSAKRKDFIIFALSGLTIVICELRRDARDRELIAALSPIKKPEEKKP